MSLTQSSQDHIAGLDAPPSPTSLASARALITSSLSPEAQSTLHPSLPALPSSLSPTAPPPTSSLDLERYSAPTAPTTLDTTQWRSALESAQLNRAHLSTRATNLALLETYGRNAWLVHNSGLEDELRRIEGEVKALRAQGEEVAQMRREGASGQGAEELSVLEGAWREGVGRGIEVQVATLAVGREMQERRMGGKGRDG